MCTIILPIKKKFSDRIFAGTKQFEYRKSIPRKSVDKILIYESQGCGRIVGEVSVTEVLNTDIGCLWLKTKAASDTTWEEYSAYFGDRQVGYAYKLSNPILYDEPKTLQEFGLKVAPQGFAYVRT